MSLVANRYAEGLFALALDKHCLNEYKTDLAIVKKTFDDVENLKDFFASEQIKKSEKKEVINKALEKAIHKDVLNFLYLLVDNKRINYYEDIIISFNHLTNEELNIKEGIIESARPLDEEQVEELKKALSNGDELIELKPKINKSLISGFKIIFDNQVIDASMKQRIENMKDTLSREDD